jgi:carbonic anhydrase
MLPLDETFFASVGCMDGRVQHVVASYGQMKFGAVYPDTITDAGLVGKLAKEDVDKMLLDGLEFKVAVVSIGKHKAKGVVVHGHQECAGNPVSDALHKDHIRKAVEVMKGIAGDIPVVGVFVKRNLSDASLWEVEEIA